MDVSSDIRPFWLRFLAESSRGPTLPLYDVFHFGDTPELASELAALVLCGEKTATAQLLWLYEASGKSPPQSGDLSVVTDWKRAPLCVIEISAVEVRAFEDITAEFAAAEGEGDRSVNSWRTNHWSYFGRVCKTLARDRSLKMPVVCERFRVMLAAPVGALPPAVPGALA